MRGKRPTILFADFFGTVKERGIAAYVRDLEAIAAPFADTSTLRAPAWVRRQPQAIQNLLMVLHEQIVVPVVACFTRPDLIVFPYNSSSFLLSLSRRTVCVIHDLIPYRVSRRGSRFAFLYVACSARWHARLGRRIIAVSPFTARTLRALPRFSRSPIIVIPNCFTSLPVSAGALAEPARRVTLISGVGPNKAFPAAIELMAEAHRTPGLTDIGFDIVGFGDAHPRAEELIGAARQRGLSLPVLTVHTLLQRSELDHLMASNAATWAHSTAEGFGRVVVEGRAAGRPVVMSRLAVFRELRDELTFEYSNDDPAAFATALALAIGADKAAVPYRQVDALQATAAAGLKGLLA